MPVLYEGMPVQVHFAYERFSPENGRIVDVLGNQVMVASPNGTTRIFRADTQAGWGDFGYQMYFNTLAQELASDMRADEAEEGLRRFRLGQEVTA